MPVTVSCTCGRTLKAKDEAAGKTAKCPSCGNPVTFPPIEDPFANPIWDKPSEQDTQPTKAGNSDVRFIVIAASVGLVMLAGGILFAKSTIDARKRAEANAKLHDALAEAIQAGNAAILKNDFNGAATALRQAVQPRPVIDPGNENEKLLTEAEATLKASEVAATEANAFEYLGPFGDASLAAMRQGQSELTSPITDAAVKKTLDQRVGRFVAQVQAKRERLAQMKREQELAVDPIFQKAQFKQWADKEMGVILARDREIREEVRSMEMEYRTRLIRDSLTTVGIDRMLDEWGGKREKMLEARTEEVGQYAQAFAQNAMRHPVWKAGTQEDQLRQADEFGEMLKELTDTLEKPVENQLASFEATFGDKLQRGMKELGDLNKKMRDTTRSYSDMFNGRLPR
ncbi:hypothetical protein TA3x_001993 [Tundrisphaera sp. TA3]|uniref:hypothetical protein n=1 Tax=Tundrisphaera sp. TA3 TaxID=3435775 RepID=UPI003EB8D5C1